MLKPISNSPIPPASPAKQLILRLAGELARLHDSQPSTLDLIDEARAYLDQPEPEGLTDEELLAIAAASINPYQDSGIAIGEYESETERAVHVYGSELITFAHAVLARWGRPAAGPEKPTVMEIIALADEIEAEGLGQVDLVRRALARWGRSPQ